MSMILDALQRADRERQKQDQPPPSLDTPTTPPPAKPTMPRRAWWLAGASVVLIVALLFVALNRPAAPTVQSDPPTTRPVPAQEPVAAPAPTSDPISRPTLDAPTGKPPAIAELYQSPQVEDESITELYRAAKSGEESASEEATRTIEGADGHTRTLPERPEPAAVRLSEAEPTPPDAASPEPDSATAKPPETTPDTTPAIASVRDLPWNLQQTMPSINYQQHDYRNGAASRVRINGKEYREGQQIAQDLTLEKIEEDGAIMRYRGHPFKLRALNSWVNM